MATGSDVALLEVIEEEFQEACLYDGEVQRLLARVDDGTATQGDALDYGKRTGEILSLCFQRHVREEVLDGGRMSLELARVVIQKPLVDLYNEAARATAKVIEAQNRRMGVGLKAMLPKRNEKRISNLLKKMCGAERFGDVAWLLGEPVVNHTMSAVDDTVRVNADVQARVGLDVRIVRTLTGRESCDWCKGLAGSYVYGDVNQGGHDVWKRHAHCDCRIEYVSKKDTHVVNNYRKGSKSERQRREIEKRKAQRVPDDRSAEKVAQRKGARLSLMSPQKVEVRKSIKARRTGALGGAWNDQNDPDYKKRDEIAEKLYDEITNRKKAYEIEAVARHSGYSIEDIGQIYDHIFIREHNIDGMTRKFDPDYYMAHSWIRLRSGKDIQEHDLIMLDHELEESKIMNADSEINYQDAHRKVESVYNYSKALTIYLENHEA